MMHASYLKFEPPPSNAGIHIRTEARSMRKKREDCLKEACTRFEQTNATRTISGVPKRAIPFRVQQKQSKARPRVTPIFVLPSYFTKIYWCSTSATSRPSNIWVSQGHQLEHHRVLKRNRHATNNRQHDDRGTHLATGWLNSRSRVGGAHSRCTHRI